MTNDLNLTVIKENKDNCGCYNYDKLSGHLASSNDRKRYCILANQLVVKGVLKEINNESNSYDFDRKYVCNFCHKKFASINELIEKKSKIVSEHIKKIDRVCRENNVEETYRGKSTFDSSAIGEWVYYDCYFDEQKLRERLKLPSTVKYYEYYGRFSGDENGFLDELTNDAVLGVHPYFGKSANKKVIE
jgi:hypothetical protein